MNPNTISGEEVFNYYSDKELSELVREVKRIKLVNDQDLPHVIFLARKNNPRAYEPWRGVEIELLKGALDKTNDLKTLSSCFGRSVNSIKTRAESILLRET